MTALARVTVLCTLFIGGAASAATIIVDSGPFADCATAASADETVGWNDADSADDVACTQCFAAVELQRYLRQVSGRAEDFAIAEDDDIPAGQLILVGGPRSNAVSNRLPDAEAIDGELAALGPEGYLLRTAELEGRRVLLVAGGGRVGTLYAAYDLLHRLGVRWYAPGEVNQETPSVSLETLPLLSVSEKPAFATRGFHAWENRGNPEFVLWMARNRLNYWCVEQEPKGLLHKLGIMLVGGGHVLTDLYLNPRSAYPYNHPRFEGDEDKPADPYAVGEQYQGDADGNGKLTYFEAHPEWFGLRDGKRSDKIHGDGGDNFCTTNEDALTEWMRGAMEDLATGRYRDADIMNVWTLDAGKWCECERCKAAGSQTDRNLLLIHRYAREIKKARAAGRINRPVRILFLAYADVLQPPTRPLPAGFDYETCIATYFPIARCYVHDFQAEDCSTNAGYRKHLYGWALDPERHYQGQICIGEYYNVSGYKCLPICFMDSMSRDIPYYHGIGARHFHYMHCTTENWGNKALTNWQMARQLWDPAVDCSDLWEDYFAGRYHEAGPQMRRFYEHLQQMLCNVSQLKYGLAHRLTRGGADLFPTSHLKYEHTKFADNDGPDLLDMLQSARECRAIVNAVLGAKLPQRVIARVTEDEALFTYGERTLQFYDALVRTYAAVRAEDSTTARAAYAEAKTLAELLAADTTSTQHSSSHANAPNALAASYAAGAPAQLSTMLGPPDPETLPVFDPAGPPLTLTGREFEAGGAQLHGYGIHAYPGRIKVSDVGNYVYAKGNSPYDRLQGWFRMDEPADADAVLTVTGLRCPEPPGGRIPGEIRINDEVVFSADVPFAEDRLTSHAYAVPAGALRRGVNTITVRNLAPEGRTGSRPWFGIDRVELSAGE